MGGDERLWSVVRIQQNDVDGQVHFVAVPADHPAAVEVLALTASSRAGRAAGRTSPSSANCVTIPM
jgi:hypothetical protein